MYDLVQDQFGTMASGKYAILSESGGYKLEKVELDETTTSVANDYKLTAATDDTITIASSDTTNVTAIQNYLAGKKVYNLTADQFGTTTGDQGAGAYIIEATGGGAYKLDKVELDTSTSGVTDDYKLTSATDDTITVGAIGNSPCNSHTNIFRRTPTSVGTLGAASSVGMVNVDTYNLNFNNNLSDGQYTLIIKDRSGNEVKGSNNHQFEIETVAPIMTDLALSAGLDLGVSNSDLKTTIRKPHFSFKSEEGLKLYISKEVENDSGVITVSQVYDLSLDQFGTMTAGKYAILSESGGYKLEK